MITTDRAGRTARREHRVLVQRLPLEAEIVLLEDALISTPRGTTRAAAGERYSTSHDDASRLVALGIGRYLRPHEVRA